MPGHGGHAAIHANRAKKFKAQLDRVKDALIAAGIEVEDEDVAVAVEKAAEELKHLREQVNELEWELAGLRR